MNSEIRGSQTGTTPTLVQRVEATRRPAIPSQGSQGWKELLFLHWDVPQEVLRPLVDERLELDSFDGRCFVGAVAFTMTDVRPFHLLGAIPTATTFAELNIRTYVHDQHGNPGVYFLSLDAESTLAVVAARIGWHLPYHRARMHIEKGAQRTYEARRLLPSAPRTFRAHFTEGPLLPPAAPDSLEFFLAERYTFFTSRYGQLVRAQVFHEPYPLHSVERCAVSTDILSGFPGFPAGEPTVRPYFSPGVDVEIFPMVPA